MVRYHHDVYATSTKPTYIVLFDSQRQIIESQRLERSTDLRKAMTTTILRLAKEAWQPEGAI
jgi:hypothetical protein